MWQRAVTSGSSSRRKSSRKSRLYTLEVFIVSGPILEKFARKNPEISRTIAIRGDHTLEDLHDAIFEAFDREDEHMYEFQFGRGPRDRNMQRYVLAMAAEEIWGERAAGVVDETTIDSLGLKVRSRFGYWFDFGDDWMHLIKVKAIADEVPPGRYPAVIGRVGESPPQYIDWDSEEADEPPPKPKARKKSGTAGSKSKPKKRK